VESVLPRFVELAVQYGSLTRGVLAERAKAARGKPGSAPAPLFRTLKGGLGEMIDALSAAIRGHVEVRQCRVEAVEGSAAGWRVRAGEEWLPAQQVVLACEAHSAGALVRPLDGRLSELLGGVPYSSSMTVALGFRAGDMATRPDGFGFLVPKKERRRLVACTWVGTKFPFRAPEDRVVARCFLGGRDDPGILSEPDEAVVQAVREELREIAGVAAAPVFTRISRWPHAMAQYPVGHKKRVEEMLSRVEGLQGLHLAGNAYHGIGIPDCIRMGRQAAERIAAQGRG
jgi:oxygen-dependent protoporphyrinogen oxidase